MSAAFPEAVVREGADELTLRKGEEGTSHLHRHHECGRQQMETTAGGRGLARSLHRGRDIVLEVCNNSPGGQHSEAGQQSQGKGFVDVERRKDEWRSALRSEQ